MPFKSEAQRKWMHANHPKMADEWEEHTPKGKKLPKKVKKEEFIRRLDDALGISEEAVTTGATSEPSLGATTGASKGAFDSTEDKQTPKKKKRRPSPR